MVPPDKQKKPKKKRKSKFKPPLKTPEEIASTSASCQNEFPVASTSASQSNQAIIPSSTSSSQQNQPSSSSVTGQSSMLTPNDVQRGTKRKTRNPLSGKARMPGSLKRKGKVREKLSSILAKIIKPAGNRALKRQTCHSDKGRLSLRP